MNLIWSCVGFPSTRIVRLSESSSSSLPSSLSVDDASTGTNSLCGVTDSSLVLLSTSTSVVVVCVGSVSTLRDFPWVLSMAMSVTSSVTLPTACAYEIDGYSTATGTADFVWKNVEVAVITVSVLTDLVACFLYLCVDLSRELGRNNSVSNVADVLGSSLGSVGWSGISSDTVSASSVEHSSSFGSSPGFRSSDSPYNCR